MNVGAVSTLTTQSSPVSLSPRKTPVLPNPDSSPSDLSQAARPVYEALQSAWTVPASKAPAFVLPPSGGVLRLFEAVQAIAAERVYPAPIFSFAV
jgi:hypothetical protein